MEKKGSEHCCSCSNVIAIIALVLSACTLIGGAVLGTCMYKKVDTLHRMWVEAQYGSDSNFESIFDTVMTDDYRAQLDENVANQIEQIKASQESSEEDESAIDETDEITVE